MQLTRRHKCISEICNPCKMLESANKRCLIPPWLVDVDSASRQPLTLRHFLTYCTSTIVQTHNKYAGGRERRLTNQCQSWSMMRTNWGLICDRPSLHHWCTEWWTYYNGYLGGGERCLANQLWSLAVLIDEVIASTNEGGLTGGH